MDAASHGPTDWDARYAEPGWQFGLEPNDFLRETAPLIPPGRVLCLAEGEGRNAVWLAQRGYAVTGVDRSQVGLEKARRLAAGRGVAIETRVADLATFEPGSAEWQGIVSIFAHTEPEVRRRLHAGVVAALAPGGVFVLEAYRPEQIAHGTGGPKDEARLMNLARLRDELAGLEWLIARELEREVREGTSHTGLASVVQLVARRPA